MEKQEEETKILEELKTNEEGKFILPLSIPVEFGEETISELILSRPKTKHIRYIGSEPSTDDMLRLGGKLACQVPTMIDELEIKDSMRLLEFITAFM